MRANSLTKFNTNRLRNGKAGIKNMIKIDIRHILRKADVKKKLRNNMKGNNLID